MNKQECIRRLKELNVYDLFHYRPETKVIPRILTEDERIEAVSAGISAGRRWMLVFGITHVYFIHVHPVNGMKNRKVPYGEITGFEVRKGFLFGRIVLFLGEEKIKVENCPRKTIPAVEGILNLYAGNEASKNDVTGNEPG